MLRESLRQMHPDLAELVEELRPFTSEFLTEKETLIVDDEDLKEWGIYSSQSILENYIAAREEVKKAEPPIKSYVPAQSSKGSNTKKSGMADFENPSASNSWVISGKHTTTGLPLIANDPHQGGVIPSTY